MTNTTLALVDEFTAFEIDVPRKLCSEYFFGDDQARTQCIGSHPVRASICQWHREDMMPYPFDLGTGLLRTAHMHPSPKNLSTDPCHTLHKCLRRSLPF